MRKYFDIKEVKSGKYKYTTKKLRKGLRIVHIGDDVWKIGKDKYINNPFDTKSKYIHHQVIYGPDDKEYHVYGNDIAWMATSTMDFKYVTDFEDSYQVNGNSTHESKAKIYILTHILDKKENWCWDLNIKPEVDKIVKIIYSNGTVKNIIFSGEFQSTQIPKNYRGGNKIFTSKIPKTIVPVAYRKF